MKSILWWSLTFPLVPLWRWHFYVQTPIGWIAIEFGGDIHGAERMYPNVFGGSMTFPPPGQSVHLHCKKISISTRWTDTKFGTDIQTPQIPQTIKLSNDPLLWWPPRLLFQHHHETMTFVVLCEMSQPPLDVLSWNFVLFRVNSNNFGDLWPF